MKTTVLLGAGLALALAGGASAQPHGKRHDVDGDGRLSRAEAVAGAQARFARLDADKDGRLTAAELQMRKGGAGHKGARLFERRDADKNGALSLAELQGGKAGRGERLFQRFDADRDGSLTKAELEAGREQAKLRRAARQETRSARVLGADGVLTAAEFEQRALARFARQDGNADGFVTPEERRALMQERRARRTGA